MSRALRGDLNEHVGAGREAERADPPRVDVSPAPRGTRARRRCPSASPSRSCSRCLRSRRARARRRRGRRSRGAASIRAWATEPRRSLLPPWTTTTAAPLREAGTSRRARSATLGERDVARTRRSAARRLARATCASRRCPCRSGRARRKRRSGRPGRETRARQRRRARPRRDGATGSRRPARRARRPAAAASTPVTSPPAARARDVERRAAGRSSARAAERERERRAQPGPQRREREHAASAAGDRDRARERVLAEAEPGSAVHEGVVERVDEREQRRDGEDQRLAGASAAQAPAPRRRTRRRAARTRPARRRCRRCAWTGDLPSVCRPRPRAYRVEVLAVAGCAAPMRNTGAARSSARVARFAGGVVGEHRDRRRLARQWRPRSPCRAGGRPVDLLA